MATIETFAKPIRLYRYRPLGSRQAAGGKIRADPVIIEREISSVEQGYIFCPSYPEMNDPMEGLYASTQKVRAISDYHRFVRDVSSEKLEIGIASFSETWNNELMWAHYADGFRGICVTYSLARLTRQLSDEHSLARIAYGDRPFTMNLDGRRQSERAKAILSTKSLMWRYEREWRLFAPLRGRAVHGPGGVTSVYLGARMAPADRRIIRERLEAAGVEVRETVVEGYSVERRST